MEILLATPSIACTASTLLLRRAVLPFVFDHRCPRRILYTQQGMPIQMSGSDTWSYTWSYLHYCEHHNGDIASIRCQAV